MSDTVSRRVLIVGCGYLGGRVARLEQENGARVSAIVRSSASAERLASEAPKAEVMVADLDAPDSFARVSFTAREIYYFVPPPPSGLDDPRIAAFVDALANGPLPHRVVLVSTTGVYGDCAGEWVNEDRVPQPKAERAFRRLAAETCLQDAARRLGFAAVVLRVAGIYGPGRLPVERLRAGEPVLEASQSPWSNRIHVDDLAQACVAAMRNGRDYGIYNATDGNPSTMTDYFCRVADVLGLPRPPAIPREALGERFSAGMRSYLEESKRIDNRRLREELGVKLRYPDLTSGLVACVAAMRN